MARSKPKGFNVSLVFYGQYVKDGMLENGRLYEHQKEALECLAKWFKKGSKTIDKTAVVVMPTGTGKTGVMCCLPYYFGAAVSNKEMELNLSKPILIIAPNLAILNQLEKKSFDPEDNFLLERGIITQKDCGSDGEKDLRYTTMRVQSSTELKELQLRGEIILSNAQQWHERNEEPVWKTLPEDYFSVVMVDEAHHLPAKQWQGIVDKFCGYARVCFFTATPTRYDQELITEDIKTCGFAYTLDRETAVARRVIRNITPKYVKFDQGAQHYVAAYLDLRLKYAYQTIDEVVRRLTAKNVEFPLPGDKKHQAMVIARDIDEAKTIANYADNQVCGDNQVCASVIHSKLSKHQRKEVIDRLEAGEIDIIVTVQMLLEGFDHPPISIAAIATRIRSNVKFQQFIGRAQRVVRSKTGEVEDARIEADMITHEYFEQRELFDHFINPRIPKEFEPEEVEDP